MPFFEPEIFTGRVTEYTVNGETFFVPSQYVDVPFVTQNASEFTHHPKMTIGRLSAPGYLDCTDWTPYASPADALEGLREMYDDDEEDGDQE